MLHRKGSAGHNTELHREGKKNIRIQLCGMQYTAQD